MGIIVQGKGLWNALFTRTQRQLLGLFFGYPERSFYANEVVRKAGVGTGSVQRGLARLVQCGLLTVRKVGNQKHFQANPDSPIFPELRGIVMKTFGATDQLRRAVIDLPGHVELAMLYGDPGDDAVPTIRMLVVTDDLEYVDVVSGFTETENRIGRTIQPLLFKASEFRELKEQGNETILEILRQPRVFLKGSMD
jgi:hypothetical protein